MEVLYEKMCYFVFLASCFAFAQDMNTEIGERVYKTVSINGEKVKKWIRLTTFTQFNNKQYPIFEKSNGREVWWKYNDKGHIKNEEQKWSKVTTITNFECDDEGRVIHSRCEIGVDLGLVKKEVWNEYHYRENIWYVHTLINEIHKSETKQEVQEYNEYREYNDDKLLHLIHYKSDNQEIWNKYDENGNIYKKIEESYGNTYTTVYKTDMKGNVIYSKNSNGFEHWYEYDSNDLLCYRKSKTPIDNAEYIYEYTYWDNGKMKTCSEYKL